MYVTTLNHANGAELDARLAELTSKEPAWVIMYGVEDAPIDALMGLLRDRLPRVPVFGATSFQGVFTSEGFHRQTGILVGQAADKVAVAVSLKEADAAQASERARQACREIELALGRRPDVLLLHATPGFEERILEGVASSFGSDVPVYGGSAADDNIAGRWSVFANGRMTDRGFVLAGIASEAPIGGGFLGGYLPTEHRGIITKVKGRTVQEIGGRPAAVVYNEWTGGMITKELGGGNVLLKTNLLPVARSIGRALAMPRRLLSHPYEVTGASALGFFTEFQQGDEITLMMGARDPLVTRVRRTVQRARAGSTARPRAALMVYCAGCLAILLDKAELISREFQSEIEGAPFLGIATFGEQGTFFQKSTSYHGNLMCSAVLF